MLKTDIEPKMKKSALVQICVLMSDSSLHKTFIANSGLTIILDIFANALVSFSNNFNFLTALSFLFLTKVEKNYENYPDSVVSVLTILKYLAATESSVRKDLSNRIDIFYCILRSKSTIRPNSFLKWYKLIHFLQVCFCIQSMMMSNRMVPNCWLC